jgi:hypothetical protein
LTAVRKLQATHVIHSAGRVRDRQRQREREREREREKKTKIFPFPLAQCQTSGLLSPALTAPFDLAFKRDAVDAADEAAATGATEGALAAEEAALTGNFASDRNQGHDFVGCAIESRSGQRARDKERNSKLLVVRGFSVTRFCDGPGRASWLVSFSSAASASVRC